MLVVGAGQNSVPLRLDGGFWEPILWGSSDVREGEEDMAAIVDILSQNLVVSLVSFSPAPEFRCCVRIRPDT